MQPLIFTWMLNINYSQISELVHYINNSTVNMQNDGFYLTYVAVNMKTAIQCNDPHGLLLPGLWHYGLTTY